MLMCRQAVQVLGWLLILESVGRVPVLAIDLFVLHILGAVLPITPERLRIA
jgi:hypothetical protein